MKYCVLNLVSPVFPLYKNIIMHETWTNLKLLFLGKYIIKPNVC